MSWGGSGYWRMLFGSEVKLKSVFEDGCEPGLARTPTTCLAFPSPPTQRRQPLSIRSSQGCIPDRTTDTMLQRSTRRLLPALNRHQVTFRQYSTTTDNPVPTNNPNPTVSKTQFSVSETNRLPSSSTGSHDEALYEDPEEGEKKRVMQAPNREGVWSRSQQPRAKAMVGPRFEQTIMEDQVRSNLHEPRNL